MAVLVKKTYSRRKEEVSILNNVEKENFDAFDELLSSPLKRDVEFKPLSFWGRKVKELERKNDAHETEDSDDNSPYRKKKYKWKNIKPKCQSLPMRNTNTEKKKIFSTSKSFKTKTKFSTVLKGIENTNFCSNKKNKSKILNDNIIKKESANNENLHSNKSFAFTPVKSKNNCVIEKFKIHEDYNLTGELNTSCSETLNCNEFKGIENLTLYLNESMNETLISDLNCFGCQFVNKERHYDSIKDDESFDVTLTESCVSSPVIIQNSLNENTNFESFLFEDSENTLREDNFYDSNQSIDKIDNWIEKKINLNHTASVVENDNDDDDDDDDSVNDYIENSISEMSVLNYKMNESSVLNDELDKMYLIEFDAEDTVINNSQFANVNSTKLMKIIEELLELNGVSGEEDSNLTSDESTSSATDEESVIVVSRKCSTSSDKSIKNDTNIIFTSDFESGMKNSSFDCSSTKISNLTNEISNLTISDGAEPNETVLKLETEKVQSFSTPLNKKDTEKSPCQIDLRNVTKRKKYRSIGRHGERSVDENWFPMSSFEDRDQSGVDEEVPEESTIGERTIFDWNKTMTLSNPIFESTRVQDASGSDLGKGKKEESRGWMDHSFALKPGKKWLRSVSVLKQIRNGNVTGSRLESSRVKGRKYESFVRDMLAMQNGRSGWSASVADLSNYTKRLTGSSLKKSFSHSVNASGTDHESESTLKDVTFNNSIFSTSSEKTMLEASFINPIIKVVSSEETTNDSQLKGADILFQGVKDSVKDQSSSVSGRDFILLQCGQDDILPFEEHFNERTLKYCRKIGEGVYGEVFMSADAVIKIIPIEGSEKVNGEPQKTFDEILSEVVIATKLSKLRNGEKNRTDGFAEVKRCWCVRGKYPKYLVQLWEEYDQMGGGSENDSPIMFKEDQLYIILELANGGKDLESFVFSSASQCLSLFIQTAFSLAAAEKEFEFEHRDLHWGNVLISPTKEKFVTITLENVEYKIPSKGVKVCIIDFTLSRICYEGFCIFNDLSVDPSLFASEGDYQFDIYRMMLAEVRNDWSLFRPRTNIFWLHYILDKMINMVRYKNKKTKLHKKSIKILEYLESVILKYKDTANFSTGEPLREILQKL